MTGAYILSDLSSTLIEIYHISLHQQKQSQYNVSIVYSF